MVRSRACVLPSADNAVMSPLLEVQDLRVAYPNREGGMSEAVGGGGGTGGCHLHGQPGFQPAG